MCELKNVIIYTDGACVGNPGPGGYGVVLIYRGRRKELFGGFRNTTNNRMEIMAAITGLEALKEWCRVTLYSDSQYLVKAMTEGWAKRWQAHGWQRGKGSSRRKTALNPDLWEKLLRLCENHEVEFKWVKGHDTNPENQRCDQLAEETARQPNLPADKGYESKELLT